MFDFLKKILTPSNEGEIKRLRKTVDRINALEPEIKKLSDDAMRERIAALREQARSGAGLDDLLPETYALVREAGVRVLGQRAFDVQLIGGIVLHQGRIAEMRTGEGKTLTATLPAVLNALSGKGVHVVTVNDYLAKFQSEMMGKIYRFLGLSVGLIVHDLDAPERQAAYAASKHALLGMTKSLAKEVAPEGIRVHMISPGSVYTDMIRVARPDLSPDGMIQPEEVAELVAYLVQHRGPAIIDEIRLHRSGKEPFL